MPHIDLPKEYPGIRSHERSEFIVYIVQQSGKAAQAKQVQQACHAGATDIEIHNTVMIAAVFCMFNRHVDGLAAWALDDPATYDRIGKQRAEERCYTAPFKVESKH